MGPLAEDPRRLAAVLREKTPDQWTITVTLPNGESYTSPAYPLGKVYDVAQKAIDTLMPNRGYIVA